MIKRKRQKINRMRASTLVPASASPMITLSVVFVVVPMCRKETSIFWVCVHLARHTHARTHAPTHNLRYEAAAQQLPSSPSFFDPFLQACKVKDAASVLRASDSSSAVLL